MSGRKEPIILVDEQDTQLEIVERPTVENDASKIIRYVYVLLFNDIGQLLLQERASTLSRFRVIGMCLLVGLFGQKKVINKQQTASFQTS